MTTRRDVDDLASATGSVVELARLELGDLYDALTGASPEAVRDALIEIVPELVREYGDAAASVAADWYEEIRAAQAPGTYRALAAPGIEPALVRADVRRWAGHLWGEDPTQTLALLSGALQRYVQYSARETIRRNVVSDPSRPRYARVPTRAKPCAFCAMVASRGFVYHSLSTAQSRGRGAYEDKYHNDCGCQVVPEWEADAHHIVGYDPDAMYEQYRQARNAVGGSDTKAVLAQMRRQDPDGFSDGVHEDAP